MEAVTGRLAVVRPGTWSAYLVFGETGVARVAAVELISDIPLIYDA